MQRGLLGAALLLLLFATFDAATSAAPSLAAPSLAAPSLAAPTLVAPSPTDPSVSLWVDRPIAAIEVTGLVKTQSIVVRRELRIAVGDVVKWSRVEADRLRLLDLGLFAEVRTELRRDRELNRPVLTFEIAERPSWVFLPRVDYDPEDGFTYGLYYSERNFRGRRERISVSGRLGGRTGAGVSYGVPWIAGRRIGAGIGLFVSERDKKTERVRESRSGVSLSLSKSFGYERSTAIYGGVEEAKTDPLDPNEKNPPPREREDHRWTGVGFSHDDRDYRVRALRGRHLGLSVTQHGGPLGGDSDMVRYGINYLQVVGTGGGTALTLGTRALLSDGPVPTYLRQNLGGINTLRGYDQGEFGGESRWIAWVEERIPLLRKRTTRIWGKTLDFAVDFTVFGDMGSIWEGNELLEGHAKSRWGGGGGLRLIMPWVDVFRIEVATNGENVIAYAASGVRL